MDYQDERPPHGRAYDAQLHRNVRGHCHRLPGPSLLRRSCLSLQTLLASEHIPGFWSRVSVRAITRSHDGIRNNGIVGLRWREIQRPDHNNAFPSLWSGVLLPKFGEPYSPIFYNDDSFLHSWQLRQRLGLETFADASRPLAE